MEGRRCGRLGWCGGREVGHGGEGGGHGDAVLGRRDDGRAGGRAAEDAVARDGDAVGAEHLVDDGAVEQEVLREDVVEAERVAQAHVLLRLVEREARAVEADEEVDDRPLLGAPLEDVPLGEEHEHDVLAAPQAVQDREHRLRPQLRLHAADPQRDDHLVRALPGPVAAASVHSRVQEEKK